MLKTQLKGAPSDCFKLFEILVSGESSYFPYYSAIVNFTAENVLLEYIKWKYD